MPETKTETKMPLPTDPMAIWTASQQAFTRMMTEGFAHYAALEGQMIERAQAAVSTWSQLNQDAIRYGAQLAGEARKLGLDVVSKLRAS